jgi:hypothetical protein
MYFYSLDLITFKIGFAETRLHMLLDLSLLFYVTASPTRFQAHMQMNEFSISVRTTLPSPMAAFDPSASGGLNRSMFKEGAPLGGLDC